MRYASGSVSTTAIKITPDSRITRLVLSHNDPTNSLEVSLDLGRNFYSLGPAHPFLDVSALAGDVYLRSSAGTINFVIGFDGVKSI